MVLGLGVSLMWEWVLVATDRNRDLPVNPDEAGERGF